MPSANFHTTPVSLDEDVIEGRYAELDDYTVGFETHKGDFDASPLFVGLPDDRCQCPHWGFVTSGSITFHFADHSERYVEGDAYYVGPGHTPEITAGSSLVEFSPTEALNASMAVIGANMAAAEAPA